MSQPDRKLLPCSSVQAVDPCCNDSMRTFDGRPLPGFDGRRLHDGDGLSVIHWLIPLLILLLLAAGVIWLVLRVGLDRRRFGPPPPWARAAGGPWARYAGGPWSRQAPDLYPGVHPGADPALAELRLRYARGDVSREDFLRTSADLGGSEPAPVEPPPAEPPPGAAPPPPG
jgi:hypothetical protein